MYIDEMMLDPIHENYRDLFRKIFNEHEKDLNETIEQHVVGSDEGVSYIGKDEVDAMLAEHFGKVEDLLENHFEQVESGFSISKSFNKLKFGMKKMATNFKDALIERADKTKTDFNEKVQDVKSSAKRQVNTFVGKLNGQIKRLSEKLDEFVNEDIQDEKSDKELEDEFSANDVDLLTFIESEDVMKDEMYFNAHGEQGIRELSKELGYEPSEDPVIYYETGDEYVISVSTGMSGDNGTGIELKVDKESGMVSVVEIEVYERDVPDFEASDPYFGYTKNEIDGEFDFFIDSRFLEEKELNKSNVKNQDVGLEM